MNFFRLEVEQTALTHHSHGSPLASEWQWSFLCSVMKIKMCLGRAAQCTYRARGACGEVSAPIPVSAGTPNLYSIALVPYQRTV